MSTITQPGLVDKALGYESGRMHTSGLFRLPHNVLAVPIVLFWWPIAVYIWFAWFVLIGWWSWLFFPSIRMEQNVTIYNDRGR